MIGGNLYGNRQGYGEAYAVVTKRNHTLVGIFMDSKKWVVSRRGVVEKIE